MPAGEKISGISGRFRRWPRNARDVADGRSGLDSCRQFDAELAGVGGTIVATERALVPSRERRRHAVGGVVFVFEKRRSQNPARTRAWVTIFFRDTDLHMARLPHRWLLYSLFSKHAGAARTRTGLGSRRSRKIRRQPGGGRAPPGPTSAVPVWTISAMTPGSQCRTLRSISPAGTITLTRRGAAK